MRTHRTIVQDAGHTVVAEKLNRPITTVRSWDQRSSIPAGEWKAFVENGWASADELIAAKAAA